MQIDKPNIHSDGLQIIISRSDDIHAHAIYWAIKKLGASPIWIYNKQKHPKCIQKQSIWFCNEDRERQVRIKFDGQPTSILCRLGFHEALFPEKSLGQIRSSIDNCFVRDEWVRFLRNIEAIVDLSICSFWVNSPDDAIKARDKAFQLGSAINNNLVVPPTLISANPNDIRAFCREYRTVVYKPMAPFHVYNSASGEHWYTPTSLIKNIDDIDDDVLARAPGIYQRYINKRCDLRVTVIGTRLFACEILNESGGQFIDWRVHADDVNCRFRSISLDWEVRESILGFMRKMKLASGSLDFVIGVDGKYYFLEVNEAGQFLFLERRCPELKILSSMTSMLIKGKLDSCEDTRALISYHDYLKSSSHKQFKNSCLK